MTTLLMFSALKKNINAWSLTMRVRIFQLQCGVCRCVADGLCKSFSFNQAES